MGGLLLWENDSNSKPHIYITLDFIRLCAKCHSCEPETAGEYPRRKDEANSLENVQRVVNVISYGARDLVGEIFGETGLHAEGCKRYSIIS
jgi:hypothetical protein